MKDRCLLVVGLVLLAPLGSAQSLFEGTWRPDPQRPGPGTPPDSISLVNGVYECKTCEPAYRVPADGHDHPVTGSPYFDTLSVSVTDDHTVARTAKLRGTVMADMKDVVSADGNSRTGTQTVNGMMPKPVELTSTYSRAAPAPAGAHAISGQWRPIETDLTHHEEDTTYHVTANRITMSDKLGRSFSATIDGADAPYQGDANFNSVSLKLIDEHTLEESDKRGGQVVQINRWTIDPDGKRMHARFDDTHGHMQQQDGRKLP